MSTQLTQFTTPGTYTWTAPSTLIGGTVTVVAYGAAGAGSSNGNLGGQGAYVQATIPFSPGASVSVVVAGASVGFVNGGSATLGAGAGGGSSAVSQNGVLWIEAGGGGGAGSSFSGSGGGAGGAANLNGTNGTGGAAFFGEAGGGGGYGANGANGAGGAAGFDGTAGGAGTSSAGGAGGTYTQGAYTNSGGGGGGGYYSGGGGGGGPYSGGGGGGSSYVASSIGATGVIYSAYSTGTIGSVGISYSLGDAPKAPTLNSPANGALVDLYDAPTPFTWTYNKATSQTGAQNAFAMRFKQATASTYGYLVSSASAFSSSIPVWNSGSQTSFTLPASVQANGYSYNWSVATQESNANLQGPFATDSTVQAVSIPTIVFSQPTASVATTTPTVQWTALTGSGRSQISYRGVIYSAATASVTGFSPGITSALYDTGTVSSAATAFFIPLSAGLVNSGNYVAYLQIVETGPVSSQWTSASFQVVLDGPATPQLTTSQVVDPTYNLPAFQFNVITADNLMSVYDSSFEGSVGAWANTAGASVTASSVAAKDGAYAGLMTMTSGQTQQIIESASVVPCLPSTSYTGLASFKTAATSRGMIVYLDQYTAAGASIGVLATSATVTDTTGAWTTASCAGTTAANAAFVRMRVGVAGNAGVTNEIHYVDNAGIFLTSTWNGSWSLGGFSNNSTVEIQTSDDNVNWMDVRYAGSLTPSSGQALGFDWEATPNYVNFYRARVNSTAYGNVVSSAWSTTASVTFQTTTAWLIDPLNLALSISFNMTSFREAQGEQMSAHYGIGVSLPVIVSTVVNGVDGTFTAWTDSVASWNALGTAITDQRVKWLTNPLGDAYYVRVGPSPGATSISGGTPGKVRDTTLELSGVGNPVRSTTVQYVNVAMP